jgi:peptidoglycan/LPS O-acetylase OafA/YrhL
MSTHPSRIHYLDNLRALAMLLGVVFHAAIAYGPGMVSVWPASGGETSRLLDVVAWFCHLWRMPLFFTISGFFAMLLLRRRGIAGFLRNRALRIALPFIVFMPPVLFGIVVGMAWAMQAVEHPGPMLGTIKALAASGHGESPPFSTAHLWFLYNLFLFCLLLALLYRWRVFERRWPGVLLEPRVLLTAVPLLLALSLASLPAPHPAPEQLLPQVWAFGFYGVFFLLGAILHDRPDRLDRFRPLLLPLLLGSLLLYGFIYRTYPGVVGTQEMSAAAAGPVPTPAHLLTSALSAWVAVAMTLVCLLAGRRFLSGRNAVMRYLVDASYWIYILHLPVMWMVQYRLMDVQWGAWAEFAITVVATLGIGLLTYALLVRWTPIGLLLNGRRIPLRPRPAGRRWDVPATR